MLFNSFIFLTLFLPPALAGYYLLGQRMPRAAAAWLCGASIVFYGWWNPAFVALLVGSIAFNYAMSCAIVAAPAQSVRRRWLLGLAITADLALLVRYKYLATLLTALVHASGVAPADWLAHGMQDMILPLGVSFFTFTQICYLLDCNAGIVKERDLLGYVQFVTFFPHLIAGPILHHKEMMTQFAQPATYKLRAENLSIGAFVFTIGLAKKLLFADTIAPFADAGFAAPHELQWLAAWGTCLAYALQLYFDFSGYSDMAVGLAKMFGVRFPLNFNSPFKAASIIDFWQRWHMTLTRYLTAYLYYPLAMRINRSRALRGLPIGRLAQRSTGGFLSTVAVPTFYTMALAGIWHGAGLQYLIYGLLHASYLTVNHAYRAWRAAAAPAAGVVTAGTARATGTAGTAAAFTLSFKARVRHAGKVLLTFVAALVAFAFFRAHGVGDALALLQGMAGLRGIEALDWPAWSTANMGLGEWLHLVAGRSTLALQIVALLAIVWCTPNSHQLMGRFSPALDRAVEGLPAALTWRPSLRWTVAMFGVLVFCVAQLHGEVRFLYFQF
ncbi:MBOAT family protein [Paraburkholderia madseniana]|uniref:Probable alginate O-acetylase AlgI n=1 Tax=Paraburkholderia madseniana TaxID=2599607 RepID=A0AAP5BK21_9BURK|nr:MULTISPECIES: MBOAT family O-acyltransferase [Paraburkholderia]MCX4151214.1 MBOAT family protein [Paraburkholderia madseniana]MDN7154146.1 MBOAT family protein [Paraburkholderia sp. WS6]MDQ6413028.1 MBOAT family protein [Paraburkholderia madseniana]